MGTSAGAGPYRGAAIGITGTGNGTGTGTGDVRRKLPAERTVLRPCDEYELCEDDEEREDDVDVLGFRCIDIGT